MNEYVVTFMVIVQAEDETEAKQNAKDNLSEAQVEVELVK